MPLLSSEQQCPELVVGAIVEFRHTYEDSNALSQWKQGIVKELRLPDVVIDVIHPNGLQEAQIANEAYIRKAKMLVREVNYQDEFRHLKGKAHGQVFASTSVVSPDCLVTFGGGRGRIALLMSIGLETNIVGGSVGNLFSGGQASKNHIADSEIPRYLSRMNLQYVMEEYAREFQCCRKARKSDNQVELMTELFDAWAPARRATPRHHNEVLTNLHPDMIFGVLARHSINDIAAVCAEFERQFGRKLRIISMKNGLFVVGQE